MKTRGGWRWRAPERRRRWSEDQKRAIVAESLVPGAVVSDVARRADIGPGQLYRWRKEFRAVADGFARVLIAPLVAAGEPTIEMVFAGKVRVRIPGSVPADLAAAVVKAFSSASSSSPDVLVPSLAGNYTATVTITGS